MKSPLQIGDAKQNVLGDFISTCLIQKGINWIATQTGTTITHTF